MKVKKSVYGRARADAQKHGDLIWTPETHAEPRPGRAGPSCVRQQDEDHGGAGARDRPAGPREGEDRRDRGGDPDGRGGVPRCHR